MYVVLRIMSIIMVVLNQSQCITNISACIRNSNPYNTTYMVEEITNDNHLIITPNQICRGEIIFILEVYKFDVGITFKSPVDGPRLQHY